MDVKKGFILAVGLVVGGAALLVGCKSQPDNGGIPVGPKWKGAPYRLTLDAQGAKPDAVLPNVKFTANPDALEKRTMLVIRFDDLGSTKFTPPTNRMIMYPTDISGSDGALSADYMNAVNQELTKFLKTYCVKGKVKMSVALARSSLSSTAEDSEIDALRMSDWTPVETVVKSARPGC
jgi:hypothetical protein